MSKTNIDKYDIKNSSLPRSDSNQNVIGYRDNLVVNENYLSLKLINYSSVGWVFGLAQYGVTPISTSGDVTEEIYHLEWHDRVIYHGNDPDLLTATNMNVTTNYKNLQFTATDINALLEWLLLKYINSTYKFFNIVIESDLVESEPYNFYFEASAEDNYITQPTQLRSGFHSVNLYIKDQVKQLKLFIERATNDTTFNTQTIKTITIYGYDAMQSYVETFKNTGFINQDETTGTITEGKWTANTDQTLVSRAIYISPTTKLVAVEFDFSHCNTNLDFTVDELYLSKDGVNWEKVQYGTGKINFNVEDASHFPMIFPITLGTFLDNPTSEYRLYYKIVAKQDGRYIDCTDENSYWEIKFFTA